MNKFALLCGPLMCAFAIAFGAFGTHAIADLVTSSRLDTWQTGSKYLMNQGLGLFLIGILSTLLQAKFSRSVIMLFSGAILFSATLFILVLTNISWLGAIAPIGGLLMILGWLNLTLSIYKIINSKATQ